MDEKRFGQSIWKEETGTASLQQPIRDNTDLDDRKRRRIDTFVQQNSPINNELIRNTALNDLYGTYVDGQIKFYPSSVKVREQSGKRKSVYTLCSLSYSDSVNMDKINKTGRYKITAYDRRIYNAVGSLWLSGQSLMTPTEIFQVMYGYSKKNPTSQQLEAIEKSLHKMQNIVVYIDLTDEVNAGIISHKQALVDAGYLKSTGDSFKSVQINSRMLTYNLQTFKSVQGKEFKTFRIQGEPCLLTYNRAKGTLISIPMEYIGLSESSSTEKTMAFQDYLLMRIMSYRNGKLKENKVLYDTLYRDSGIDRPKLSKDFIRDREAVRKLLEEWVSKGLLSGYTEIKEKRSYIGIQFFLEDQKMLE